MDSGSLPLAGYGAYQDMGFWNVHVPLVSIGLVLDWLSLFRVVGLCISLTGGGCEVIDYYRVTIARSTKYLIDHA